MGIIGFFAACLLMLEIIVKNRKIRIAKYHCFLFSAFSTLILLPFVAIDYVTLISMQLVSLILVGITSAVGQLCVTTAYKYAAAKDISIYSYASVIFSAILGALLFEQYPDVWSWLGYVIIFIASWFMFVLTKSKQSEIFNLCHKFC